MNPFRPKKGTFRFYRGIRAIFDTTDPEKYREVLPDVFDMPEFPQILTFVTDYIRVFPWPLTRYQEGATFLRCRYQGNHHWHTLTMPVTKRVARWGGRRMGYPKYIADKILLTEGSEGKWTGEVFYKNRTPLKMEFTPGWVREPLETEKWFEGTTAFLDGSSINLMPPEKGPGINAPYLDHKLEPQWNPINGMLKIAVDPAEKIYGLYDQDKTYLGMFNEFRGGVNLIPRKLS
jgi:hypothetical protein